MALPEPSLPGRRRVQVSAELEPGEELRLTASVAGSPTPAAAEDVVPGEAELPLVEESPATEDLDGDRLRELLDVAVHEMRSPLVAVSGFTDLLLRRWSAMGTKERLDLIERVKARAGEMHRLLDRLAELAPPKSAGLLLHPTRLGFHAEVERCTEALGDQLREHPVVVDAPEDLGVYADPGGLEHVLKNLLSNAAKFSSAGSPIMVLANRADDGVRIGVKDDGIGIAEQDQERIFERRFSRGTGTSLRSTGLGLSIARAFVEAHGGRIWVESAPGEGSTFWFTIPDADIRIDADT